MEEEKVPKINTGVMETWPLIRVFPLAFRGGASSTLGETDSYASLYRYDLVLMKKMFRRKTNSKKTNEIH